MSKIHKPSPPEHLVVVDTNLLWHEDKSHVVHPDFDTFWDKYSVRFPMKLMIPQAVEGELLFQQTTSALKRLEKANQEISEVSKITRIKYSHRITQERIKQQVNKRLADWVIGKGAEITSTPIGTINWASLIEASIWRHLPFTLDAKNPKNEKGFRDALILETVAGICSHYATSVKIAFLCEDFALRTAAEKRLGGVAHFSTYESLKDFESFIELTQRNLTEAFVKSILSRARDRFYKDDDRKCLLQVDVFKALRNEYVSKIESPADDINIFNLYSSSSAPRWELLGNEQVWITRPQFDRVEAPNIYFWISTIRFVRLYQRPRATVTTLLTSEERRLMVLSVDVSWKASVRSDGRFFGCEIVSSKEGSYSFKEPTPEEIERYGIQKKLDEIGGSTVVAAPTPVAN